MSSDLTKCYVTLDEECLPEAERDAWNDPGIVAIPFFILILTAILLGVGCAALPPGLRPNGSVFWPLVLLSSLAWGIPLAYHMAVTDRDRKIAHEGIMMAGRLVNCAEKAALLITEMPKQLADAADAIGLAETEFSSKAFAPFWDAVETAANSLGHLHSAIEKASRLTRGYRDQLAEPAVMNHDFPVPSEFLPDVPEPTLVLQALARVVRQGQTNIDFALVWEHRQTRKVLIAGFQTLGEAIRDLGSQIDSSFGELQGCIASSARQLADESRDSLAGASEQQLKLQREQDGKLDNIQRGRYLPP